MTVVTKTMKVQIKSKQNKPQNSNLVRALTARGLPAEIDGSKLRVTGTPFALHSALKDIRDKRVSKQGPDYNFHWDVR